MKKNKNGLLHYFRLEPKLAQQLDKRIARAGYQSRSEFFTAVAHIALHGDETEIRAQTAGQISQDPALPENIRTWLKNTMPAVSEDEIQQQLQQLINAILFPVIAMKGKDIAFHATWQDIRSAYHDQTGIWVTESDLYQAYETFAAGANAYAVRDSVDDAWSAKYSCAIGDDTFNVTITREYMLISGFAKDTTLEAIETWADTIEEFGGETI